MGLNKLGLGSGWLRVGAPAGKCLWQAWTTGRMSSSPKAFIQRWWPSSSLLFLTECTTTPVKCIKRKLSHMVFGSCRLKYNTGICIASWWFPMHIHTTILYIYTKLPYMVRDRIKSNYCCLICCKNPPGEEAPQPGTWHFLDTTLTSPTDIPQPTSPDERKYFKWLFINILNTVTD